jgi:hypothetical protein
MMKSFLTFSVLIVTLFLFSPAARATIYWTDSDFVLNAPGLCAPGQNFSYTYKVASGALVNYATITHRQNAGAGIDCSKFPVSGMGATYDIVSCTEDLKIVAARDDFTGGYRFLIYEAYYGPFRIKIEGYGCTGENGQKSDAKLGGCMNLVTSDLGTLESIYESSYGSVISNIVAQCGNLEDACGEDIPLPQGISIYYYGQNDMAGPEGASNPAEMKPLFVAPAQGDGETGGGTIHIGFCPFKGPVDIYILFLYDQWDSSFYILNAQGRAEYLLAVDEISPWRSNVKDEFTAEIPGDFGGLFKSGDAPPLGFHEFFIGVAPHGEASLQNLYLWTTEFKVDCERIRLPLPTGRNIYFHEMVPVSAWSQAPNPSEVRPFAVGPAARGGDTTNLHYALCPFECDSFPCPSFDVYYGLYSPEYDPNNIYFYNLQSGDPPAPNSITVQALETYLWKKLPLSQLPNLNMPEEAIIGEDIRIDPEQLTLDSIAIQSPGSFSAQLPSHAFPQPPLAISAEEMVTYHLFAISEHGVRDKYYAWVTAGPNLNIKDAIVRYWHQTIVDLGH